MSQNKNAAADQSKVMDKIVSLAKRRGFVFQSSEIYGGLNGCWDYGPLGVEMLNNLKQQWWKSMTYRENIEGLDASILMHPRVWEASGHVENFTDPMVDCKSCKARYRLDVLFDELSLKRKKEALRELEPGKFEGQLKDELVIEEFAKRTATDADSARIAAMLPCPNCGNKGTFTDARKFNLMFKTFVGPVEDSSSVVFLRPETAQGIFVNFLNVQSAGRQKIPFGIAQIGKAFRNEINTKNFLFRTREFEQMEMQFFVQPGSELEWFKKWKEVRMKWHQALGFGSENYRFHDHVKLAHYANAATDIEFKFPFGFKEVEGIHSRTDYDLKQHQEYSGKKMQYFDPEKGESYIPYVIETSIGVDRMFLQVISAAYHEEELKKEDGSTDTRIVLRLPSFLAPVKLAVMPLVKKDGLPDIAEKIVHDLKFDFNCQYDDKDSIGRRYRRQDAIGTPYCITIDHQTLEDKSVTIRYRDTMLQERVQIEQLVEIIKEKVSIQSLLKKL